MEISKNKILLLYNKVTGYGITDSTTPDEVRRIKFSNLICLVSIIFGLSLSILDWVIAYNQLKVPIFITLSTIPVFAFIMYLNSKKKFWFAKRLLAFTTVSLTFVIGGIYFGNQSGVHYLFILFAIVPIVISPMKEWKFIFVFVLINLLCFTYVELFSDSKNVLTPYPEEYIRLYRSTVVLSVFILLLFILLIYEMHVMVQEKTMIEQNKRLSEMNEIVEKSRESLIESNASKDKFFSIIAHDMRRPIVNLMYLAEMFDSNIKNQNFDSLLRLNDALKEIASSSNSLLENLLTWAKIQRQGLVADKKKIPVKDFILAQNDHFRSELNIKNLEIISHCNDESVFCDPNMLSSIIRNVFSNAIKFSRPGGCIEVQCMENTNNTEIIISDQGIGIPPENLNDLFRLEKTFTTRGTLNEGGSGLGLIICKELVELNNGTLRVESEPEKGTSIILTLPKS